MKEIKHTPQGFSYVDVSIFEVINWGGIGICNSCGKGPFRNLKLIWVLGDTYCENCKYFKSIVRSGVTYFKCEKMGTSYSSATDIRKNDIACILYEVKNDKTY